MKETYEDTDYFYIVMDYYHKKDLFENIKDNTIDYMDYSIFINKL